MQADRARGEEASSISCYMKGLYMILYDTINEMYWEVEKAQGRDTLDYARQAVWTLTFHTFLFAETNISSDNDSD
jgi:hypothetical protein